VEVTCDPQKVTAGDLFQVSNPRNKSKFPEYLESFINGAHVLKSERTHCALQMERVLAHNDY